MNIHYRHTFTSVVGLLILALASLVLSSCARQVHSSRDPATHEPAFLKIEGNADGGYTIVSISPFDGTSDTLAVERPLTRLVLMSTSYIGFVNALGCDSDICGVSGADYVCDSTVADRFAKGLVAEVGYEASPDYEKILSLKPDLLLTYQVSGAKSQFISKLESLGLRVFVVNEHLEQDPVSRAAYIRLFGALTGTMHKADSILSRVADRYDSLRTVISDSCSVQRKVLLNIPYNEQWFIPGMDNYMSALIQDAGGDVLGAAQGESKSSVISVEEAYGLSKNADLWLNVGWCTTMQQVLDENPLFADFLTNIESNAESRGYSSNVLFNNNLRLNRQGGNDFWESGVVRPDIILEDLIKVLHPEISSQDTLIYYRRVE